MIRHPHTSDPIEIREVIEQICYLTRVRAKRRSKNINPGLLQDNGFPGLPSIQHLLTVHQLCITKRGGESPREPFLFTSVPSEWLRLTPRRHPTLTVWGFRRGCQQSSAAPLWSRGCTASFAEVRMPSQAVCNNRGCPGFPDTGNVRVVKCVWRSACRSRNFPFSVRYTKLAASRLRRIILFVLRSPKRGKMAHWLLQR